MSGHNFPSSGAEPKVAIRTFGHLEVRIDGEPLHFSARAPRRPLEFLTALVAQGGTSISVGCLSDLLWPDADGFDAYRCFTVTLHRLRALLTYPDCVRLRGGHVTLDPESCAVDFWDLERALRAARDPQDLGVALARYDGPFLGDDTSPWASATRARLER